MQLIYKMLKPSSQRTRHFTIIRKFLNISKRGTKSTSATSSTAASVQGPEIEHNDIGIGTQDDVESQQKIIIPFAKKPVVFDYREKPDFICKDKCCQHCDLCHHMDVEVALKHTTSKDTQTEMKVNSKEIQTDSVNFTDDDPFVQARDFFSKKDVIKNSNKALTNYLRIMNCFRFRDVNMFETMRNQARQYLLNKGNTLDSEREYEMITTSILNAWVPTKMDINLVNYLCDFKLHRGLSRYNNFLEGKLGREPRWLELNWDKIKNKFYQMTPFGPSYSIPVRGPVI